MIVTYLEGFHPVVLHAAILAGLIDRSVDPGVPNDPTQPAHTIRGLRLDRIGTLLQAPDQGGRLHLDHA